MNDGATSSTKNVFSTAARIVEPVAWAVGVACLGFWTFVTVAGAVGSRQEMSRFATLIAAGRLEAGRPDLSLWSAARVRAWRETLTLQGPAPLAVLRIKRIGLEVPVLEGTDDWTLNRAVGHIADTAIPGTDGNTGIAGHRDGFFRALKDVVRGDVLELETPLEIETYRVDRTWVVEPDDVSVLNPSPSRDVTLVTCYPFYYVGSAPQRFVVRAVRAASARQR
jgi:sortase A